MNVTEIIGLVVGSGVMLRIIEHLLTRKITKSTKTSKDIANIGDAVETWEKMVDKLESRVERLLVQVRELRDENCKLKEEVYHLRNELANFRSLQNENHAQKV